MRGELTNKIADFLEQAGAWLDEGGGLQLEHGLPFPEPLPPHAPELAEFAELVTEAYGKKGLPRSDQGRMVHQLRYYIDEHNIAYVRRNYGGDKVCDRDALRAYADAELDGEALLRDGARLHNKAPLGTKRITQIIRLGTKHKLLTPNRHSEFIVGRGGWFVTQWDWLERDSQGRVIWEYEHYRAKYAHDTRALTKMNGAFANTESFNYAPTGGASKLHTVLDVDPARMDPDVRRAVKLDWKARAKK